MKKNIYIFLVLIFSNQLFAQTDSLSIESLKVDISTVMQKVDDSEKTLNKLYNQINLKNKNITSQLLSFDQNLIQTQSFIDSLFFKLSSSNYQIEALELEVLQLKKQLKENFDSLNNQTNELDNVTFNLSKELTSAKSEVSEIAKSSTKNTNSIDTVNQVLSQKQQNGLIFLTVFLFIILMIYFLLFKKQNLSTKAIAAKQKEIFEKQIEDSQQFTNWLSEQSSKSLGENSEGEIDHSFAKRVADEIVRITTNLSRMDSKIKGYKQLSASVRKLEQSLNSNGYELEDLLNKSYNNGMNIQANFVVDESLNKGESMISRIIKPQINYKGKLIQAAQVEVSQGE
ncbi:hypothetical protein N8475_10600 [Winogradskyella sp.]|nr:hypothetical protein [Winogradskyella sp.]